MMSFLSIADRFVHNIDIFVYFYIVMWFLLGQPKPFLASCVMFRGRWFFSVMVWALGCPHMCWQSLESNPTVKMLTMYDLCFMKPRRLDCWCSGIFYTKCRMQWLFEYIPNLLQDSYNWLYMMEVSLIGIVPLWFMQQIYSRLFKPLTWVVYHQVCSSLNFCAWITAQTV